MLAAILIAFCGSSSVGRTVNDLRMDDPPEIEVRLEPETALAAGTYVQSQLRLRVQVVSPWPFSSLDIEMPSFDEMLTVPLRTPSTREVEFYGFRGHVHERHLALFPRHSGTIVVPSIRATGSIDPAGRASKPFAIRTEPFEILVKPMPTAYRADWWLSADEVTIADVWSAPLKSLKAGDTVRRTVTVTSHGSIAEQLVPMSHPVAAGYTVIGSTHDRSTSFATLGVTATLTQSFDLLIHATDHVRFEPIALSYWNPVVASERRVATPEVEIEPLPGDRDGEAARLLSSVASTRTARWRIAIVLIAFPMIVLSGLALISFVRWLPNADERQLARAARRADHAPAELLAALRSWQGSALDASSSASRDLAGAVSRRLQQRLYSAETEALDVREVERQVRSLLRIARVDRAQRSWRAMGRWFDRALGPRRGLDG